MDFVSDNLDFPVFIPFGLIWKYFIGLWCMVS